MDLNMSIYAAQTVTIVVAAFGAYLAICSKRNEQR